MARSYYISSQSSTQKIFCPFFFRPCILLAGYFSRKLRPKKLRISTAEALVRARYTATYALGDAMMTRLLPTQHNETRHESHGSRTLTEERTEPSESHDADPSAAVVGRLHLQGHRVEPSEHDRTQDTRRHRGHVVWSEDTIDNEGMGKKKSKSMYIQSLTRTVCCIFHKKRAFDESSSESSDGSDDDVSSMDDSDNDSGNDGASRPTRSFGHGSSNHHEHALHCTHIRRGSKKNAYERG